MQGVGVEVDLRGADAIVIFSDVHGNWQALEAVLDDVDRRKQSHGWNDVRFVNLGDSVGYGPDPLKCLAKVKEISDVMLKGNHEEIFENVLKNPKIDFKFFGVSHKALKGIYWTVQQLFGVDDPIAEDFEDARNDVISLVEGVKDLKSYKEGLIKDLVSKLMPDREGSFLNRLNPFGRKDPQKEFKELLLNIFTNDADRAYLSKVIQKLGYIDIADVSGLPYDAVLKVDGGMVYVAHANPIKPENFYYLIGPDHPDFEKKKGAPGFYSSEEIFREWPERLGDVRDVFVGHMHFANAYSEDGRYLVSVGSVGRPRVNSENTAEYSLLISGDSGFELVMASVDYNHDSFVNKARAAGLWDEK